MVREYINYINADMTIILPEELKERRKKGERILLSEKIYSYPQVILGQTYYVGTVDQPTTDTATKDEVSNYMATEMIQVSFETMTKYCIIVIYDKAIINK